MQSTETLMPHEIPVRPWQIVATDLFHFDGSNFILIVDYYLKYPFVWKLNNFSSQEVIDMTKKVFGKQGVLERVISDNSCITIQLHLISLQKSWRFDHRTSPLKYPQSNGIAEHCMQLMNV